jgi:hypothetical protein
LHTIGAIGFSFGVTAAIVMNNKDQVDAGYFSALTFISFSLMEASTGKYVVSE